MKVGWFTQVEKVEKYREGWYPDTGRGIQWKGAGLKIQVEGLVYLRETGEGIERAFILKQVEA